tara:strand:- start:754 stop:1356 length:603 start_codon:yes stop_codon:yes gene_type:complete
MMIDWKKLPAYKAEPRIDSLVGYYLDQILNDFLDEEISMIIPELPIRLGTVKPEYNDKNFAERSYKVDFFAVGKEVNYLIEFKSDSNSRREKQDDYLKRSENLGTKEIIDGIIKIATVSSYKKKYNHLKEKLKEAALLNDEYEYSGLNKKLKIIYVQPKSKHDNAVIIDFHWISNWLKDKYPNDSFSKELSETLKIWAED